jgi:hypothetical protein
MSIKLDVPQSGKLGTTINLNTRYGQVARGYTIPKDPKTPAQMRIRTNLGHIAPRWRELEQEQRDDWMLAGQDAETRHRLGRSAALKGFNLFLKLNCSRAALGLSQFVVDHGVITLKLYVPSAPAQYTVVCGAAPCSAGRSSTQHFNILGFLPAPVEDMSDITDLYVAMYGRIPARSRIFIRTQQHIDGWDDLPKQTTAIVPKG